VTRLLTDPDYAFADAYAKGDIRITRGAVYDVIATLFRNLGRHQATWKSRGERLFRKMAQRIGGANSIMNSRRNARRHYDIDERLYRLFLDDDMQYSCAYFERPDMTLEEAQTAKKRHIIAKLHIPAGARVLDIGCGWGGLALSVARANPSVSVLGVTLSPRQLEVARDRALRAGLSNRVEFQLKDYRELDGTFDRIVSVGMFEHVGPRDYGAFFGQVCALLAPEGVALLHTIGRTGPPAPTNPWIRKHIFPGGHIPALSEIIPAIEGSRLITGDVETLRLHYAETLLHWRRRFGARRNEARRLYDEEFCRMWEFYLAGSEASFRWLDYVVFQIQLLKSIAATPIVRDYMLGETEPRRSEAVAA
jgi:cyclopropane-fatty-acyl-phospholipid synthase